IITAYITVLGNQWISVADLLNIFQVEDLPELEQLGKPALLSPVDGAPLPPENVPPELAPLGPAPPFVP
ncbi:MAG TPA: hypothetical protein VHV77_06345, partial [Pirellulales bacterium]|nr:hypothetical protein [Pirellulales bacterium]